MLKEINNHPDYVVFPDAPKPRQAFRHAWILRRRPRPFVPQPDGTPMADGAKTLDDRASSYLSIYVVRPLEGPFSV